MSRLSYVVVAAATIAVAAAAARYGDHHPFLVRSDRQHHPLAPLSPSILSTPRKFVGHNEENTRP